ncbi:inosine/xanthosine triphosphatase [Algoriphagus sp. D3-2-R+10]|uniref:inosine/xanthosine triphosphatase n=1 Tax=Algoriphagus aurantiacus TaxID=3103948 RepID=UPI002B39C931|nr:inosine/xanthosine triphosphatase [Algoriphagus sp. D3-2-R+10]MEB2773904.1 inosine/xanthosine triphosphatase [Algoriphagus sp. D3-2-R+10]
MNFPKRENFKASEKPLVIVGSKNPVKVSCTESAFTDAFSKGFIVNGITAASQVPDQPKGDEETYLGARNRVINSKKTFPEANYWVGIEGGIGEDARGMYAFAWIYIEDKSGLHGKAKTGTFYLPEAITTLIHKGMELGEADDQFFSQENSKQSGGSVGILTHGVITRQTYYNQAITLALIPFLNKELF